MKEKQEKVYVVHVSDDDYFVVLAKSKDEAVERLQEYWRPCNDGLGKIWTSVSEGYPIKSLQEGRHFGWFESIAKGGRPDDAPIIEEPMGNEFKDNIFQQTDRVDEEIKALFPIIEKQIKKPKR